jgi:hypothetical protein
MFLQPWEEPDGPEKPITVVRSVPVPIRFEVRTAKEEPRAIGLVSFYGKRRIAMASVTPDRLQELTSSPIWSQPVTLEAVGSYEPESGALVLSLYADVSERLGWVESEEQQIWIGCRYRGKGWQRFPGQLERETRDFFLTLLQGNPRIAIGHLLEEARQESVRRHKARQRSGGHPPAGDIAEGVRPRWPSRKPWGNQGGDS